LTLPRLHLVTSDEVLADPGFGDRAVDALAAGAGFVALHLRGPDTAGRALYRLAERLLPQAVKWNALLMINDRVDVAMATGAHGVQLGGRSLPVGRVRRLLGAGARVGRSVHGQDEASSAAAEGADFVVFGTVHATGSHPGLEPAGVAALAATAAAVGVPVLGIGGMSPARAAEARIAGAWGVAVLSDVWAAPDAAEAVGRYRTILEDG